MFEKPYLKPKNKNYYEILGVTQNVNAETLKSAYRELAKKYHPDLNPKNKTAEEKFKELAEAYSILSNPAKRRNYDESRRPKEIKVFVGERVREQFIQRMQEYSLSKRGRVIIKHERSISIGFQSEFAIEFLGAPEEYKNFLNYLQRLESQTKQRSANIFR